VQETAGFMPGSERNRYATGMVIMLCIALILFPEKMQALFCRASWNSMKLL